MLTAGLAGWLGGWVAGQLGGWVAGWQGGWVVPGCLAAGDRGPRTAASQRVLARGPRLLRVTADRGPRPPRSWCAVALGPTPYVFIFVIICLLFYHYLPII